MQTGAINYLRAQKAKIVLHPNDDVNMSQSSNDTFPTALHIAGVIAIEDKLLPALVKLKETFKQKAEQFKDIIKIGRTHLQDATPLTLGQEISGWHRMLEKDESNDSGKRSIYEGNCHRWYGCRHRINAHPEFGDLTAQEISQFTGKIFTSAPNKFHALTSHDEVVYTHGALKALRQI